MKRVDITAYGTPEQVALCVEVPDPGPPGPSEVTFEVLAFPINPADVMFCRGVYRLRPPLPATPGAECVGRVLAAGDGVSHVAPGDLVINLQRENWAQRRRVRGDDVVPLPAGIDLRQAAMVRINPPTAMLMLTDVVALEAGAWVLQNAANSAVDRLLVRFARSRGLHTVNVVRREALFSELTALGADICLVDGPDLAERVRAAVGGIPIRLALDAVAGHATRQLAAAVADGGTVCNYGAMTGEDVVVGYADLIFRGVSVVGFMLGPFLARRSPAEVRALYAEIATQVGGGSLGASVEAVYSIEDIGAALAHEQRTGRSGKVLVAPNGMI
ncbi:zinc-dependent alcohol dehydrogenase family protein [Falsiroseomonas sp. HW251]|uniref:zinc-dependent alcohol dehydrogenase family protein n=1 Tax=Falsiroseomonas sp. HW251 TaxID=3390998 RepID=UPI003D321EEC